MLHGDGTLGVEQALVAVDVFGGLLDVRPGRLRPVTCGTISVRCNPVSRKGDRRPGWFGRVRDRARSGAPNRPRARKPPPSTACNRTPRWAARVPWPSTPPTRSIASTATSSRRGRGVAQPDAVLVLGLAVGEAVGAPVERTNTSVLPGRWRGSVEVGDATVRYPLLASGDAADDQAVVVGHRHGDGLQSARSLPASGSVAP